MAKLSASILRHVTQEPFREILKFKYRNFRFRGLAAIYFRTQPRCRRRLKWQIFDAALEAAAEEAIKELRDIFSADQEPMNILLAPALDFLNGRGTNATEKLNAVSSNDTLEYSIRRSAFFLNMIIASRSKISATVSNGKNYSSSLPHFQFWDANTPPDVGALLKRWKEEAGVDYKFFCDADAQAFIGAHFGRDETQAYNACRHPAAKSDFFRLCALYHFGGSYSDADTKPLKNFGPSRQALSKRPAFWIATDVDFLPRNWFLSSPPRSQIYEHFINEAASRLRADNGQGSIFNLAGPGMIADVLFSGRERESLEAGYTNFFGETNLMVNISPRYKNDERSWQLFEGARPKPRQLLDLRLKS